MCFKNINTDANENSNEDTNAVADLDNASFSFPDMNANMTGIVMEQAASHTDRTERWKGLYKS
ncbi:hypothetical protein GN244_ATG15323 [Phytophthora infestans]|uniref:Uncharacterized protein n=1 Tax=Phytophthora infestans TaxID=4787 RepID=A0A833SFR4_PHYIN|nr:hypothetical protein GN244_ATG15323 [Phytophthora infestans]